MKVPTMSLLTFVLVFCFLEHATADRFVLPTKEILNKYFNLSLHDLSEKCNNVDVCLTSKIIELEKAKRHAGENLINHLVKIVKQWPIVTEFGWNVLIKDRCLTSDFFHSLLKLSGEDALLCLSKEETPSDETLQKAWNEYVRIYCSRVKRLAKKRFYEWKN